LLGIGNESTARHAGDFPARESGEIRSLGQLFDTLESMRLDIRRVSQKLNAMSPSWDADESVTLSSGRLESCPLSPAYMKQRRDSGTPRSINQSDKSHGNYFNDSFGHLTTQK